MTRGHNPARRLIRRFGFFVQKVLASGEFGHLERRLIELNDVSELKRVFGWTRDAVIDDPAIHEFEYVEDANRRRLRDAECLGAVVRNADPRVCLDIGTSTGRSAALMAANAPQARVYTVNVPPEEIAAGKGGAYTTIALEREKIGAYYRQRGLTNITQILANTATWEPDFGPIDVAFIDGCHDAAFVYHDSRKALRHMKAGSFLLWHDFNPSLVGPYAWIRAVCRGVERLYADGLLAGSTFHVRDSWVGIHRVADGVR